MKKKQKIYHTVGTVPKSIKKIPHCGNSSKIYRKIPHCGNSSKIQLKNGRKGQNG